MQFKDLQLSPAILRAIEEKGYSTPTPIQMQAIPAVLEGNDLLAASQTGTGKTAGFTLPILHNLISKARKRNSRSIRCLILTPTRELAMQVEESVKTYSKHSSIKSTVVFGGVNINPQIKRLRTEIDILVATPGRLLDLIQNQKAVDISGVETLVLDEADRMLDMGFINDIRKLLAILPKTKQSLLFSATFSPEIKALAKGLLNNPKLIEATTTNSTAETIAQTIHPVDSKRKKELLSHLISSGKWEQVLVFTRTKHGANRLTAQLECDGISAAAIHSNKSQTARVKALAGFKEGVVRVLVATDIAARGLDITELPHVVNYDLPHVPEDYVHRIGRTGRAGNQGEAISLVCIDEEKLLKGIERLLKRSLPKKVVPNYEPDPSIKAQPLEQRTTRFSGQRRPFAKKR
jgi:ATP-dependent RNA helicase RhlE